MKKRIGSTSFGRFMGRIKHNLPHVRQFAGDIGGISTPMFQGIALKRAASKEFLGI
jgi:hypothetical protein